MLSCQEVAKLANQCIDKELSIKKAWLLRLHLLMCHHCRRYIRHMKLLSQTLRQQGQVPPAGDEQDKTIERVLAEMKNL